MYWKDKLKQKVMENIEYATSLYPDFKGTTDEEMFNQFSLACMQAVNYFDSLAVLVLEEKKHKEPLSYLEVIDELYKMKILPKTAVPKLKRLFHLRNLYAHKRYMVNDKDLEEMFNLLKIVENAVNKM
ncbi:MAG: hypothetical protein ACP5KJ_03670 [Candidatus Micrarchaeia archaeon]